MSLFPAGCPSAPGLLIPQYPGSPSTLTSPGYIQTNVTSLRDFLDDIMPARRPGLPGCPLRTAAPSRRCAGVSRPPSRTRPSPHNGTRWDAMDVRRAGRGQLSPMTSAPSDTFPCWGPWPRPWYGMAWHGMAWQYGCGSMAKLHCRGQQKGTLLPTSLPDLH